VPERTPKNNAENIRRSDEQQFIYSDKICGNNIKNGLHKMSKFNALMIPLSVLTFSNSASLAQVNNRCEVNGCGPGGWLGTIEVIYGKDINAIYHPLIPPAFFSF